MRITFLLPDHSAVPAGGPKVVFEYANRLAEKGHDLCVVMPNRIIDRRTALASLADRIKYYARKHGWRGGYAPCAWFEVDPAVRLRWVPSLAERHIPDADILVATFWQTAEVAAKYSPAKGIKHHLIQGDERGWDESVRERVRRTWRLPFQRIVVSRWLQDVVADEAGGAQYIPNGLDFITFGIDAPIEGRNSRAIIMQYHRHIIKGSHVGIAALCQAKSIDSRFSAVLFGTLPAPRDLPYWMTYHHNPPQKLLRQLYNGAAIYVGPGISEGWGLTGCEAAQCGAALCVTDIGGHREYAVKGRTAVLCPPGDSDALARSIIGLARGRKRRIELAQAANKFVQRFDWGRSVNAMERLFAACRTP